MCLRTAGTLANSLSQKRPNIQPKALGIGARRTANDLFEFISTMERNFNASSSEIFQFTIENVAPHSLLHPNSSTNNMNHCPLSFRSVPQGKKNYQKGCEKKREYQNIHFYDHYVIKISPDNLQKDMKKEHIRTRMRDSN